MREAALRIVDCLRDRSYSVGELADAIDKSQSWTSEVVSDLEDNNLVDRADGVQLAYTYEATLLADLLERYALNKVLTGTKEDILVALLGGPKTITELQMQGFAKSTLYMHLMRFRRLVQSQKRTTAMPPPMIRFGRSSKPEPGPPRLKRSTARTANDS